jgi:hypothetical protein
MSEMEQEKIVSLEADRLLRNALDKKAFAEKLKVRSVRYFNTRRGLGYEAQTNQMNVVIWNDGNGGGTYIAPYYPYTKDCTDLMENEAYLEGLIDQYEGITLEDKERIIEDHTEKLLFQERFNGENNTEHLKPY